MSIGPLGIVGSAAGTSLQQTKGTDVVRTQESVTAHLRKLESDAHAETAAGIGETDGDNHQTNERDADGRLPYQFSSPPPHDTEAAADAAAEPHAAKDPTGRSGSHLDLSG